MQNKGDMRHAVSVVL